jgi:hypothetical protein
VDPAGHFSFLHGETSLSHLLFLSTASLFPHEIQIQSTAPPDCEVSWQQRLPLVEFPPRAAARMAPTSGIAGGSQRRSAGNVFFSIFTTFLFRFYKSLFINVSHDFLFRNYFRNFPSNILPESFPKHFPFFHKSLFTNFSIRIKFSNKSLLLNFSQKILVINFPQIFSSKSFLEIFFFRLLWLSNVSSSIFLLKILC